MVRKNAERDGSNSTVEAPVDMLGNSPGNPGQYGLGRVGLGHDPLRENADVLSDKEIQDLIYDAFAESVPTSETADVAALVEDHIVTLKGRVSGPDVKEKIAELVWALPGVRDIQNDVSITEIGGSDA